MVCLNKEEYLKIIIDEEYKLLTEIIKNGELKEYRKLIEIFDGERELLLQMFNDSPLEIYNHIFLDYLKVVHDISLLVPGLSTGLKDGKNNITIYTYNGKTKENGASVSENTRFDLASITKLFTAIMALKLAEDGKFDFDKLVSDYKKYPNLNIKVENMVKFNYELKTDGRLDDNVSLEELLRRLRLTKIVKDNTFIYSDIPFIILKDILNCSDKYFEEYFNEEMKLFDTSYDRSFGDLTGGIASEINLVNDLKARNFEKYNLYPGHAGIFSTSKDLIKLFDNLNRFLSHDSIIKMITPIINTPFLYNHDNTFSYDIKGVKRISRAMGVYYKHPEGIRVNEMANPLSKEAFAIAGFTGTWACFDLMNGLSSNFLANPFSRSKDAVIDEKFEVLNDYGTVKVDGKTIQIFDGENIIYTIPFTRITNVLKEESIYTLLKLRFAKKVLERKAVLEQSSVLKNEIVKVFETEKIIRRV